MAAKSGRAKNKRSIDEKIDIVMNALLNEKRRIEAVSPASHMAKYGRMYTMAEIAKLSGYARSSRFMFFLYELCDRGYLAKSEHSNGLRGRGFGITEVSIYFCLAEFAPYRMMNNMFAATVNIE